MSEDKGWVPISLTTILRWLAGLSVIAAVLIVWLWH